MDSTRVDKWLWAVRIYPTRTAATDACHGGHVRVNGASAKPSTTVRAGDRVTATTRSHERMLEVLTIIDKRVGAPVAATCLIDHSPLPEPADRVAAPFVRDRATGRPTKRDRRKLDQFRANG